MPETSLGHAHTLSQRGLCIFVVADHAHRGDLRGVDRHRQFLAHRRLNGSRGLTRETLVRAAHRRRVTGAGDVEVSMTRRQTRFFFVAGTTCSRSSSSALTIHSHTRFAELTHADAITPEVIAGKHVWHRKNCINCHTLLGEGAYYAPDLTKIAQHRGDAYLRQFLQDPARSYSEERHGRLMPNPRLSEQDITHVIAFLTWISRIDNQNWPPRPILVSAASPQGIGLGTTPAGAASLIRWPWATPSSGARRPPASAVTRCRKTSSSSAPRSPGSPHALPTS